MDTRSESPKPHRSVHEANHQEWEYGRGAVIWGPEDKPIAVNIAPHASNMHAWLRQESQGIWTPGAYIAPELEAQRNPYTESLATLAASFASTLNDALKFIDSAGDLHATEVEILRVRLECELILYAARFSEATIKQMLHCTAIPPKMYRHAAMGQLLERDCLSCRRAGLPTHSFSLIGSLAHQFFLCHEFEGCAFDHLIIANKRRNLEAAHSSAQRLNGGGPLESKQALKHTVDEVAGAFAHLLSHIAKVEVAMVKEIKLRMKHYPSMPPISAYNFLLTKTVADYDREGVYRGFGYRDARAERIKAARDTRTR